MQSASSKKRAKIAQLFQQINEKMGDLKLKILIKSNRETRPTGFFFPLRTYVCNCIS